MAQEPEWMNWPTARMEEWEPGTRDWLTQDGAIRLAKLIERRWRETGWGNRVKCRVERVGRLVGAELKHKLDGATPWQVRSNLVGGLPPMGKE